MEHQEWFYTDVEGAINVPYTDKLTNFLDRYNLKSKQSILRKLRQNDIDYDKLIQFEERDFRITFNSILEPSQQSRLLNALKTNPESCIFKVRINISDQERNAINFIQTSMNTNKNEIQKLNKILHQNTIIIENLFEDIIAAAMNQKNKLILELNTKSNDKQHLIEKQITDLKHRQNILNECYKQSQYALNDTLLDPNQRKHKILGHYVDALDITSNSSSVTQTNTDINIQKLQNDISQVNDKVKELNVDYNDDIIETKTESESTLYSDGVRSSENIRKRSENNVEYNKNYDDDEKLEKKPKKRRKRKRKSKNKKLSAKNVDSKRQITVKNNYKDQQCKPIIDSWFETNHNNGGNKCNFAHGIKEFRRYNLLNQTSPNRNAQINNINIDNTAINDPNTVSNDPTNTKEQIRPRLNPFVPDFDPWPFIQKQLCAQLQSINNQIIQIIHIKYQLDNVFTPASINNQMLHIKYQLDQVNAQMKYSQSDPQTLHPQNQMQYYQIEQQLMMTQYTYSQLEKTLNIKWIRH